MADMVLPGPVNDSTPIREAVCVHTSKIFDSCKDKDCIEDLRVYPTCSSAPYIEAACSVRPKSAELLYIDVGLEEISFNRGFYTVDAKFFYKIKGVVFPGGQEVTGLAMFDKRVILFGSEGNAKTFTSNGSVCAQPVAVVEAVDPLALGMKLTDTCVCGTGDGDCCDIPACILSALGENLAPELCRKRLYVTLGQFSIIRLERDSNLIIPTYDYCIPCKECEGGSEEDPCTLFSKVRFPVEEFFPPDEVKCDNEYRSLV